MVSKPGPMLALVAGTQTVTERRWSEWLPWMDLETGVKDLAATEEDELDDDDDDDDDDESLDNSSMEPLRCFLAGRPVFSANSASSSATLFFNMSSELLADMVRQKPLRKRKNVENETRVQGVSRWDMLQTPQVFCDILPEHSILPEQRMNASQASQQRMNILKNRCEEHGIPITPHKIRLIDHVLTTCCIASGIQCDKINFFLERLTHVLTGSMTFNTYITDKDPLAVDATFLREFLGITGQPPPPGVLMTTYLDGTTLSVKQRIINVLLDSANPSGTSVDSLGGLLDVFGTSNPNHNLDDLDEVLTAIVIVGATGKGVPERVGKQKQNARDNEDFDDLKSSNERFRKRAQEAEPDHKPFSFPLLCLPQSWSHFSRVSQKIILNDLEFALAILCESLRCMRKGGGAGSAGALMPQLYREINAKEIPPNVSCGVMEIFAKLRLDGCGGGGNPGGSSNSSNSSNSSSNSNNNNNSSNNSSSSSSSSNSIGTGAFQRSPVHITIGLRHPGVLCRAHSLRPSLSSCLVVARPR